VKASLCSDVKIRKPLPCSSFSQVALCGAPVPPSSGSSSRSPCPAPGWRTWAWSSSAEGYEVLHSTCVPAACTIAHSTAAVSYDRVQYCTFSTARGTSVLYRMRMLRCHAARVVLYLICILILRRQVFREGEKLYGFKGSGREAGPGRGPRQRCCWSLGGGHLQAPWGGSRGRPPHSQGLQVLVQEHSGGELVALARPTSNLNMVVQLNRFYIDYRPNGEVWSTVPYSDVWTCRVTTESARGFSRH